MDRLFNEFDRGFWATPFRLGCWHVEPLGGKVRGSQACRGHCQRKIRLTKSPSNYQGLDEKDIEVKLANGGVTIKGTEGGKGGKERNYQLQERRFGSFERYFTVPEGVDADKIEANFKKGILTVTLPKGGSAEAREEDRGEGSGLILVAEGGFRRLKTTAAFFFSSAGAVVSRCGTSPAREYGAIEFITKLVDFDLLKPLLICLRAACRRALNKLNQL